jgi:thiol-disulfide isomerase/thioredoxin
MKRTRSLVLLGLVASFALSGFSQEPRDGIQLQPVKYVGLQETVRKNRGKVVLVDFWADFCVPCKKGFPHVVAMHQKHAKDGLAVVSVSLDPVDDPNSAASALRFLKKAGAEFTNLYLQESPSVWQKKLGFAGPPCYFVFDRQGKWTKFEPVSDAPVDYEAVEKFIVECLREQ